MRSARCLVRPPGHQATPQILRAGPTSEEFRALGRPPRRARHPPHGCSGSAPRGSSTAPCLSHLRGRRAAIDGTGTPAGAVPGIAGKPAEDGTAVNAICSQDLEIRVAGAFLSRRGNSAGCCARDFTTRVFMMGPPRASPCWWFARCRPLGPAAGRRRVVHRLRGASRPPDRRPDPCECEGLHARGANPPSKT